MKLVGVVVLLLMISNLVLGQVMIVLVGEEYLLGMVECVDINWIVVGVCDLVF